MKIIKSGFLIICYLLNFYCDSEKSENNDIKTSPVAVLSDTPASPTASTTIDITVGGRDVVAYRYKLDLLDWSMEYSVEDSLSLSSLRGGPHTIYVIAKGVNNTWQSENDATSFSWNVEWTTGGTTVNSGNINATWTMAGNPYHVQGDITVRAGSTLTIEPGVIVLFNSSDSSGSGIDPAKCEIIVQGNLIVEGSAESPVLFTSEKTIPSAGDWYGIRIEAGTSEADISYSEISFCRYGVVDKSSEGIFTYQDLSIHDYSVTDIVSDNN